jgi:hypothetical protein
MDEKANQERILEQYANQEEGVTINADTIGPPIIQPAPGASMPWQTERPIGNQLGWITLKLEDFPTRGLFYPKDTTVAIRAANGGEIRHWSTLEETDLAALDDMLNYVIERCVTIKSTNPDGAYLSWKDIKEVDRFYLLLAIQELTFANGENKLQVKISDTKKIDVRKDMINYISLDPKLMQYYDEDERCFILKPKNGKVIKLDIPCVGVTQWLKNLIIRKQRTGEYLDEDYLSFAPFVVRNWRGLTEDVYNKFVEDSHSWGVVTISLLVHVKQLFSDTINPVIKYTDEGGTEQTAPLNFQGGVKSIFLIPDPFRELE